MVMQSVEGEKIPTGGDTDVPATVTAPSKLAYVAILVGEQLREAG
jgi:hypothetical protein